jgi:hypothetical protein
LNRSGHRRRQREPAPGRPAAGTLYVGNNNLLPLLGKNTFSFNADGTTNWATSSLGSVAASPLLTADGKVIVGGFDGYVRAYAAATGEQLWETPTRDHVYASAALLPDGGVVVPSCDGTIYALDPQSGAVRWAFDTREPVRSSPAVDADGNVYVGSGEGRLYVLKSDGTLRWSMALIAADTTDFGALVSPAPSTIDKNQPLTFSLLVRDQGDTTLAILDSASLQVTLTPPGAVSVDLAGDGKFLTVTPGPTFAAAPDGTVQVAITGKYLKDLSRTGLKLSGGTIGGAVDTTFTFTVRPDETYALPLPAPQQPGDPAGTWEISRLALPLPTIMPSYNQIGFDSLHYLVGIVEAANGKGVAWMAGARLEATQNTTVIDPATKALLPLALAYDGGTLTLSNQDGLSVEIMNAVIPFRTFRIAGHLDATGAATDGGARLAGSTVCAGVPTYGPFLQTLGLCNPQTDVLTVFGGAYLKPYQGGAQAAPAGVGTVTWSATATEVTATLAGSSLHLADHVAAIFLVDAADGSPVTLSYGLDTQRTAAADGTLAQVTLPRGGKALPPMARAYLMIDTYPAAASTIALP